MITLEQRRLRTRLSPYFVAWPSAETCEAAATVFAKAHLSHGTGILDALIGQIAVDMNAPLFPFNLKHYAGLAGVQTREPYRRTAR